jgi:hypothetical protein
MTDDQLIAACEALEPTASAKARMENQVMDWLEAANTPLWSEWVGMLRLAPVQGLGFAFAGAAALFFTTPLLSMLQFLN